MKRNYLIYTLIISLLMQLGSFTINNASAESQKKTRTRLKVYYEKLSNDNKKISIILFQGSGKSMAGVEGAKVLLSIKNIDEELELTYLITDSNGEAYLLVEANYVFPIDENGFTILNASYGGNDSLRVAKKEIKFVDIHIELAFDIVDSIKNVKAYSYLLDSAGNKNAIKDIKLKIGVERLYSTLYLEEIETDESGQAVMEFPNDIPGDSIGNLIVVARLNEHDDYGTITKSAEIKWGTLVDYSETSSERTLFGDEAPLWMIISVAIILAGAWFHFILATLKVLKIKKLGQEQIS